MYFWHTDIFVTAGGEALLFGGKDGVVSLFGGGGTHVGRRCDYQEWSRQ